MGAIGKLVAARYLNGQVVKGRTIDFHPGRAFFHVNHEVGPPTRVDPEELKAVFFVKSLDGNPEHREEKQFPPRQGAEEKIWIEFSDGEELAGWSVSFASTQKGFYLFPTDENSNIERAYVFRSSLVKILHGGEAETAARQHDASGRSRKSSGSPQRWDRVFDIG